MLNKVSLWRAGLSTGQTAPVFKRFDSHITNSSLCHLNTPGVSTVCLVKYLISTHKRRTCRWPYKQCIHTLGVTHSSRNSFGLFTTSCELSRASSHCHGEEARAAAINRMQTEQVHCDAISKVRPEDLIYTWPMPSNFFLFLFFQGHGYDHRNKSHSQAQQPPTRPPQLSEWVTVRQKLGSWEAECVLYCRCIHKQRGAKEEAELWELTGTPIHQLHKHTLYFCWCVLNTHRNTHFSWF